VKLVDEHRQAFRVVLDPVAGGGAEILVVDDHLRPWVGVDPGEEVGDEVRVVARFDPELGDRERLFRIAFVEAGERAPFGIGGVEVGPRPVDPSASREIVLRQVLLRRRGARGEGAPDDRHRGLRQPAEGRVQRRQAGFGEAFVDHFRLAAAVDDHVDAAEGAAVVAGRVGGLARLAGAFVGGVDVEAAVRLAQRPHVGAHLLRREEVVQPDQVAVPGTARERGQAQHLGARLRVGGGDVDHRPGAGDLPALDRVPQV